MGQATSKGRSAQPKRARRRNGAKGKVVFIGVASAVCFVAGFILLWSLGSMIVGGQGFPWTAKADAAISPVALQAQVDHPLEPLVDMRAFRDLSYVPVKGIYVTSYAAGSPAPLARMIAIADQTEINAFVIDITDNEGKIAYNTDVPMAKSLGLIAPHIADIDGLIATLRQHNITAIARICTFQDSALAEARPDLAVQSTKGGLWRDNKGMAYTNPYNHEVWDYEVQVAEDAARHGFREIQFDYVRFPSDGILANAKYPGAGNIKKEDAIAGFLGYAKESLEPLGVWVSADVFGLTTTVKGDSGIGQQFEKIAQNVDIVCPMVYPSHYDPGSYGIASPNASPYELVTDALKDAIPRLVGTGAMVRPWLQDFSLGGVTYGVDQVKAEIKAAEDLGFKEWLLWDPSLTYTVGALRSQGG
jgi:hypothetical protein